MIAALFTSILSFFLHAFGLKAGVSALSTQSSVNNDYGKAIRMSLGMMVAHFLLYLVLPNFIALFIYPLVWCGVIMKAYKLSLPRSIAVAGMQSIIRIVLVWLVGQVFNISTSCGSFLN